MTTFVVSASNGRWSTEIATVAELDRLLDDVAVVPGELPFTVAIVVPDRAAPIPVMMEVGVGHPERSWAFYVGEHEEDAGWAYDPAVPEAGEILINYGGQGTEIDADRARVTPAGAREAARRFVATGGQHPTNLGWY